MSDRILRFHFDYISPYSYLAWCQLGVFGVPTMAVDDELFWGTDSFPHLARYLAGDDPVRSEDVEAWLAVPVTAHR